MKFALLTLLASLALAAVAGWFSIIGIMSIYAGARVLALIMGVVLESGKLTTTSWLYQNWQFASWKLKIPLVIFTLILMIITSIGIFGFLSKAHLEQGAGTVDNGAKVERLNQQIAREKSIITDNEKVITQLDAASDSYLGKDRIDKSVSLRKAQAPQRKQLRDEIDAAQTRIDEFSDKKLKLESEVRQLQLDVGPIRYIAELFYGADSNTEKNIESAVRIFTLIIVSTLDPLAVILLIAANHSILRLRNEKIKKAEPDEIRDGKDITNNDEPISTDGAETSSSITEYEEVSHNDTDPIKTISESTVDTKEETLLFPVLSETVEHLNEKTEDIVAPDGSVSNGSEPTLQSDTDEIDGLRKIPQESTVPEVHEAITPSETIDEEAATTLEESEYTEFSPLISTGHQVHASPTGTMLPNETQSVEEEIQIASTTNSYWAELNPVIREIMGRGPHFIPKKVHEEEKHKELRQGIGSQEDYSIFKEMDAAETKTTKEIYIDEQTEDIQKNGNIGKPIGGKNNRYPKALSWLNEFKRV